MINKITTLDRLSDILTNRQQKEERVVFTNGCFDLLHIGHIRYLQSAKALGDLLVVGVNSDKSVLSLSKGPGRPLIPVDQRMEVLAALTCVDYIVKFDESTPLQLIKTIQPDVLVKGGDWSADQIVGKDIVEQRGGMVKIIPLVPAISTSMIVERIQNLSETQEAINIMPTQEESNDQSLPNSPTDS